jgi:5'-3' exonuclease
MLDKEEIIQLAEKYDNEEDQWNTELEGNLGNKLRTTKELTKEDLIQIIEWKFVTNPHRKKRTLNLIKDVSDSRIRKVSNTAFNTKDEILKIKSLMGAYGGIKGVGLALASTILTFYDPKNYYVFDIHLFDELFETNSKTRPNLQDAKYYAIILDKLRKIANDYRLDVRIIEKALFKKNLDRSKD